jgi:hypothetical protein
MVLFQHDTGYTKITKKYLRLAAVYRRFAERSPHYDFSMRSLIECFRHETYGDKHSPMNGYVHGKHLKDITVSMWIEDIDKCNFCKAEFLTPLNKWWVSKAFDTIMPPTWFPFQK